MQLNYSTALFLLNPQLRAIMCAYESVPVRLDAPQPKQTMFKTFDKTIAVGDILVVPSSTRHQRTTVKVVAVDVEVDFDNQTHVDWVVAKLDAAAFDKVVADESKAISIMKAAEAKARRDEIRAKVVGLNAEELQSLPIAQQAAIEKK